MSGAGGVSPARHAPDFSAVKVGAAFASTESKCEGVSERALALRGAFRVRFRSLSSRTPTGLTAPSAVVLVNLGSPAEPTREAVQAFLDEFLSDPLVVDLNPFLWWLIRKALILPRRSAKVAELYKSIWTPEGSPLIVESERARAALQRSAGPNVRVALAMRYGEPALPRVLRDLAREGHERIRVVPMFPQFSRSTTGSIEAALARIRPDLGPRVALDVVPPYFAHPGYIRALAASVREHRMQSAPAEHLVFSFHGLPVRFVESGDPYRDHCEATARALASALDLADGQWTLVWQSRFGREAWLQPAADVLVPELAKLHERLLIVCPGFTADCLETLEEIGQRLRHSVLAASGRELRVVPCLNARADWIEALADLALGSAAT
jgi:ferrochelatase